MKNKISICLFLIVICIIHVNRLTAQDSAMVAVPDTTVVKNKWQFLLEPYMMFPNMDGTTGLGGPPDAEVSENPGDIFKNLQFAAMLYAEARKGLWTFSSDLTYMDLHSHIDEKNGAISGDAKIKQTAWELAGMRALAPWFELGLAFQLNSIKSDVGMSVIIGGIPDVKTFDINQTWVDPSILTRIKFDLSKKWFFQFRGNIGGGGIGSDLYWQLQSYFGYRFSKLFQLSAGYRVIYIDYETGSGNDLFVYNMTTFGPAIRFGFNLGNK